MRHPRQKKRRNHRYLAPLIQALEGRRLLTGTTAHPTFVLADASSLTPPFSPEQIREAYSINSIPETGAGQTIAIIDAYNDPDIASDVTNFDAYYNLQAFNVAGGPTFTVVNQNNAAAPLPANAAPGNWDLEESLDVEYAHSIAPGANIILFEANSSDTNDLYAAVGVAKNIPGVSVITMSWGGEEDPSDPTFNSLFTTPVGHQGITFIASTGDSGVPGGTPAMMPNVLAVGGSSLTINSDGSYGGESAWSDGGGGISQYEIQPDYQTAKVYSFSTTQRTIPDVSWLADPNTGVNVLDTYAGMGTNGYIQIGGTSLATPMWGGLISMIDQARVANGSSTLDGPSQTLPMLYDLPANAFHDITSGNNGYAAAAGYDLASGLGTPNAPVLFADMVGETTLYVDSSAPGITQNGSSWADAYTTLTQALAAATGNDEILVSQGTYYPSASDDPTATLQLQDNVAIYGGYAGYGTANPNAQNSQSYNTIFSGNLGGGLNTYHIVTASGTDSTAILDGVTIEDGNSNAIATDDGAGLYNVAGSPTITNCDFSQNSAALGGAVFDQQAAPLLVNCSFSDNTAEDGAAMDDFDSSAATLVHCSFTVNSGTFGAFEAEFNSSSQLTDCTFAANFGVQGGAIEISVDSTITVISSVFTGNTASEGGAINVGDSADSTLINCLLVDNTASEDGGAGAVFGGTVQFINCTIAGNTAPTGGAFDLRDEGRVTIANSIIWDNSSGIEIASGSGLPGQPGYLPGGGYADVSYSDTQDGEPGAGNIDADPQFIRNPGTNGSSDLGDEHLSLSSPCIDDGNNAAVPANITTDLDGRPRFVDIPGIHDPGAIVDMGAYEAWENIVYVDSHATGANTGSSWANAFTTLTAALAYAVPDQTIEVAGGTYYPTSGTDRTATFQLINNVTIEGGFGGVDSASPDVRDTVNTPSILSGDIGVAGDSLDNSYHVVTASYTNFTAVLDGFTITGGNADSSNSDYFAGGGMIDAGGNATINNCTFTNNTAIIFGGAVLNEANADPVFTNCTFTGNTAGNSTYNAFGGAMVNYGANPVLVDCTFTDNLADSPLGQAIGGAIENEYSTPTLVGCQFIQNSATGLNGGFGGALDNEDDSSPEIDNTIFEGNTTKEAAGAVMNIGGIATYADCVFSGNAAPAGGAMYNFTSADPNLINCTFAFNLAEVGGAIVNDTTSIPVITNSILWGDESLDAGNEIYLATTDSGATVTHSDIDGGYAGTGNMNADPLFLRDPDPGTDEQWGTADDYYGNLSLSANSPAIDIGDNSAVPADITTDVVNQPRFIDIPGINDPGAIVDLGAYERQLVSALAFNFNAPQQLDVQFSANVSGTLAASDLQIVPQLGGAAITPASLYYDTSTNIATFSFASPLPAGIYQAMLNSAITDSSGNVLSSTYSFTFLYIPDGQSLSLPGNGNVYIVQQSSMGVGSTLDIGNDELIIQYDSASPASPIQSSITSGNITSSDLSLGTAVGYFDDGSQVTIRRTWDGDANLDGVVNSDDLSLLYLGQLLGQTSWQFGNFNYGSKVTTDDWSLLFLGAAMSNGENISALYPAASAPAFSANTQINPSDLTTLLHNQIAPVTLPTSDLISLLDA